MTHAEVQVNPQGRVTIPAPLRSALGFEPGTTVVAYVEDGRLVLEGRAHVLARLQNEVLAAAARSGQAASVVDELLAERRAEAAAQESGGVTVVLDASAVLTLLYREPGHEVVAELVDGALISSVNWSEVTQKLAQRGVSDPAGVAAGLLALGADVLSFHRTDAETAAALWPAGRAHGLSLGDRACLATAKAAPAGYAVTADAAWADVDAGVEIRVIRDHLPEG